ncbi:hypothetical protein O3G_MSEX015186 [Manduca sexta]|uniref:RNA-directed DNA polymerase n=1 Tax=Manduca sexta TaxID=7130 RepID=A0A921ZW89_MANSE|nr:hypothetical protein O3G_MSEX015186 [Manduca sexta]
MAEQDVQTQLFVPDMIRFSGEDPAYTSSKWAQDLDDNAEIFGWTPQQRLVIARRSLTGTAELWLKTERVHKTYDELKTAILKEFPDATNIKEMHELMAARKKRKEESFYQYMLIMKEMGKRAKFPDYIAIQYIIDGIVDLEVNKSILYGAATYPAFKEKLTIYEMIKKKSAKHVERPAVKQAEITSRYHCYNCGGKNHVASACGNGLKCFKCNQFGHISTKCTATEANIGASGNVTSAKQQHVASGSTYQQRPSLKQRGDVSQSKPSKHVGMVEALTNQNDGVIGHDLYEENVSGAVMQVVNNKQSRQILSNNALKAVKLGDFIVDALVDTGSNVNLMSEDLCEELKVQCVDDETLLSGLGLAKVKSCGKVFVNISVDGHCYSNIIFHVISKESMPYRLIIGQEFLKNIVMVVREGAVLLLTQDDEWLARVNCCMSVCEVTGHISNVNIKTEVTRLIEEYRPNQIKEAPIQMKIVLKDDIPVAQRPRRLSIGEQKIVEELVEEWLHKGIIRVSFSEYASPIVLIKKKDGSSRLCIDYRQLNKKIIKDEFPLPIIDNLIDKLGDAKIFSVLDLKNGFYHLKISEESVPYTSFITHHGQFEFLRAPFGLSISPKYFSRFVSIIFRELIAKGVMAIFIDDIVIPAVSEAQAVERLRQVLDVASQNGLEINWKKAKLVCHEIEYLGHLIKDGEIRPSPDKIQAVAKYPEPKNIKQIMGFIGLTSYFRKYIKDYAKIARPLTNLMKKGVPFIFEDEQRYAFNILKQMLTSEPVLKIYNPNLPTELHTDASSCALAAILLQLHPEGELHPVHYMSRKTTEAESRYSSYELEALAIVEAVRKFRHYLYGMHFKIVTDCKAFEQTLKKKDLTPKVARWVFLLDEYDYVIEHRAGHKMQHVDALSRNPFVATIVSLQEEIRKGQEADDELKAIREIILKSGQYCDFWLDNGILYKGEEKRLVVPRSLEKEIIRKIHQKGHFSVRKMKEAVGKDYYLKNMNKMIEEVVVSCIPCLLATRKEEKQEGYLNPINKEDIPFHTLHLDHIGPFTETRKQYNYILTMIDAFTKFIWLFPTKSTSSAEVLMKLQIHQQTFGNPSRIITDRGTAFTSKDFEAYCKDENIQHIKITTGVPRGNGQVERVHRILIPMLTKLCLEDKSLWYRHVSRVQRAINSTYQRAINTSPFQLLTGTKMRCKEDIQVMELLQQEIIESYDESRESLRQEAKQQIQKLQDENKTAYDKKRKPSSSYELDDLVAIKRTQFGPGQKVKPKFLGPYRVVKVKRNDRYDVEKLYDTTEGPNKTSSSADLMKKWPGIV